MGYTRATHIFLGGGIFLGFSLHYSHYEVPGIPLNVIFSSLVIYCPNSFLGIFLSLPLCLV